MHAILFFENILIEGGCTPEAINILLYHFNWFQLHFWYILLEFV